MAGLVIAIVGVGGTVSERTESSTSLLPGSGGLSARAPVRSETCRPARSSVAYYRALTWSRQLERGGARATRTPIVRGKGCRWARYASREWQARARSARVSLERWIYHHAWWRWLPANWRALGACETGYGREPGNWAHANSSFVSAFGISRSIYDRDAAHAGVPGWDDSDPPTPREQYLAAAAHLELWGDGWTCPGP